MTAAPLSPELRFARSPSGARIAWATNGRGPTLIRVAHWMTDVQNDPRSPLWRPWLERLGRSLQVVRYDERGCGASANADATPPSLEASVADLSAVVDACGEAPLALLGASGAAPAAIAYAVARPQRVSHLVLLGGYLCGLMHRDPTPEALAFHEARAQLMQFGWGRNDPAVQQFFTTTMLPDATPEQAAALNEQQRLSCSGERAAAMLRARAGIDVRALAARVSCPTLVLHAQGDLMVAPDLGRELAAAIPGARFELLDTRNHIPLAGSDAFERLCAAIESFVGGVPSGPALTPRERSLAALVAQGLDNRQIAAHLGVTDKTVRNALSLLYGKLDVEGRPQAIVRARDLRL